LRISVGGLPQRVMPSTLHLLSGWVGARREDTNVMLVAPNQSDLHLTLGGTPEFRAEAAFAKLGPAFNPQNRTALFIGVISDSIWGISA
jgi:hypothetical protein